MSAQLPKTGESSQSALRSSGSGPARLSVVEKLSPRGDGDLQDDAEILRNGLVNRAKINKRGEKWADKLMEEVVDLETFKKALSYLSPHQYRDITHERHLNGLCSYSTCSNAPREVYTPNRRFKISTSKRTIKEKTGNEEEGFCSKECEVKSNWIEAKLEEVPVFQRAGKSSIQLLEEMPLEKVQKLPPSQDNVPTVHKSAVSETPSTANARKAPVPQTRVSSTRLASSKPVAATAQLASAMSSANPAIADMISNLTIHERPTTSTSNTAQSGPSQPTPPIASSSALPSSSDTSNTSSSKTRRATSSLVATPADIRSTVLSASRQMGPIPQLAPDSESEEDEERDWGEAAMGLEWGEETEEMRNLFEEAKLARQMMEEDDGDTGIT